jgi:hypothetical protein
MRDYAGEGIEHFYFMMLQKDEVSETLFDSPRPQRDANGILYRFAVHRRN